MHSCNPLLGSRIRSRHTATHSSIPHGCIGVAPYKRKRLSKVCLRILPTLPPSDGEARDKTVHQIEDMFGRVKTRFK
jgi:hypothetical protein